MFNLRLVVQTMTDIDPKDYEALFFCRVQKRRLRCSTYILKCTVAATSAWTTALPRFWGRALAIWCRLAESRIHKLDLARVFPGRHLNWFVHGNGAFSSGWNSGGGSVWWMAFIFCPRCLDQQVKDGLPVHRRAEWTLAFLTHCPQHQDEPLRHYCLCCHREEPRWIITREGKDEEVQCRHCGTALSHWPRGTIDRFSPPLQLTLRLESTILRSLSGQAPDPFWVGNVDAETFANG